MALTNLAPRVALLGGGYTLQRVAKLLPSKSFVITSRSMEQRSVWQSYGWLCADVSLELPETIDRLLKDYPTLEVVVDSVPPLRSGDPAQGARNLAQVIRANKTAGQGIQRVIYLRDGSEVDEATPANPWNPQAAARLASEEAYRELVQSVAGIEFTALRLPAIYGADRGVLQALRAGTYALIDDGSQFTNRIHVDDLARVIKACIEFKGQLPGLLCVSDDAPTRAREVVSYLCERYALPHPGSVSAQQAELRGAYTMLSNQRIKNLLLKELLGIKLLYPSFRDAF
jgi:hypothetical protein